jgi:hypothetical protein
VIYYLNLDFNSNSEITFPAIHSLQNVQKSLQPNIRKSQQNISLVNEAAKLVKVNNIKFNTPSMIGQLIGTYGIKNKDLISKLFFNFKFA